MAIKDRVVRWAVVLGCGGIAALVVAAVLAAPNVVAFVFVGAVGSLLYVGAVRAWRRHAVIKRFRAAYSPAKDLLIVYTDSPHWSSYIESNWVKRWDARTVVLNRGRPWSHESPEAALWQTVAGSLEHTPIAIVVPASGRVRVVRFWRAFRDFKHGKDQRLHEAERRLEEALAESRPIG